MQRKPKKKSSVTCILTADWHIRGDRPICRTDNYIDAQGQKILFIQDLALKYDCPILVAGDIGHRPLWGDKLLNWFIKRMHQANIISICGQHDLPNHRLDKWEEAGVGVLSKKAENFVVGNAYHLIENIYVRFFHYGESIKQDDSRIKIKIALCHMMVIKSQKDKLWNDQVAHSAKWYLKKYPSYDLIVTGDNHQSFAVEYEGRWLVNPGSLMRMSANQIDHRPSVYLWYAEDNDIERVYLPIEKDVISREHIEVAEQRNTRIEAFVNRLIEIHPEMGYIGEDGLSFEGNMKGFLKVNKVKKGIVKKVWGSMG